MITPNEIYVGMRFKLHGVTWLVTGGLRENLDVQHTILVKADDTKERRMLVKTITTAEKI
jgi:hypothetical protein